MATARKSSSKSASKKGAAKKGAANTPAAKKSSSSGSRSKSASAKKSAKTSSPEFQQFDGRKKGSAPKDGELVEFIDSVPKRGVYNAEKGGVYVNGDLYTPHAFRKVENLSPVDERNLQIDHEKRQEFRDLGVPAHRIGENLHEQNPDLMTDIIRNQTVGKKDQERAKRTFEDTLQGEKAEEVIVEEQGLQGTGLDKNKETTRTTSEPKQD